MRLPLIDGELLAQREVLPEQVAAQDAGAAERADHELEIRAA